MVKVSKRDLLEFCTVRRVTYLIALLLSLVCWTFLHRANAFSAEDVRGIGAYIEQPTY